MVGDGEKFQDLDHYYIRGVGSPLTQAQRSHVNFKFRIPKKLEKEKEDEAQPIHAPSPPSSRGPRPGAVKGSGRSETPPPPERLIVLTGNTNAVET